MQVKFSHQAGSMKFYQEVNPEDRNNPFVVVKNYGLDGMLSSVRGIDSEGETSFEWCKSKTSVRKFNNGCGKTSNPSNVLAKEGITIVE